MKPLLDSTGKVIHRPDPFAQADTIIAQWRLKGIRHAELRSGRVIPIFETLSALQIATDPRTIVGVSDKNTARLVAESIICGETYPELE